MALGPQQRIATLLDRVGLSGFEYAMPVIFSGRLGGLRQTFDRQRHLRMNARVEEITLFVLAEIVATTRRTNPSCWYFCWYTNLLGVC
jgi:hypothetical protein